MTRLDRREFLLGGAAALAAGATASAAPASKLAQRRPGFGAAATLWDLQADPRLGEAISTYCTQVVPVLELKWPMLRPNAHTFNFERADAILDFARENDLTMRGHALAWYHDIPDWAKQIKDSKGSSAPMSTTSAPSCPITRKKLTSWDVVNEPIPDNPKKITDRRDTFWTQHLGNRWIPLAFRTAAAADPFVKLAINEYDIESAKDSFIAKRAAYRNLIMDLLDQGVPLHAVGLQSHLHAELEIDTHGLAEFVTELRSWGLEVLVTELDVDDQKLTGNPAERDAIVAKRVDDLLTAISTSGPVRSILTWGSRIAIAGSTAPSPARTSSRTAPCRSTASSSRSRSWT
ncbi:endo-1,4-beta-xylanase [Bradyrhizobium barranii subsp. barranii]|uniref:Beta-xylanase n=1 Tax=Bradyrhizobium barranii subsp. barranii TaxID=2823807 RepID=A0A939M5Z5_9BRAD|nr:endo-1,4-beta-xylanase [Bradyrhizobium barranii]UEM14848.1 endo-1,4-beta-xylanase [Bradyrhizobium barranii subsp. barranii]